MRHLFFFTLLLLPTYSHVVFEEIGTTASSPSYILITVNVGLQEIKDNFIEYVNTIFSYKALVNQTNLPGVVVETRRGPIDPNHSFRGPATRVSEPD